MNIMTPHNTTFERWALDLNRSIPSFIIPIPSKGVEYWWDWVNTLINMNNLYSLPIGNRSTFPLVTDWKKWALQFIQSVQSSNIS